MNRKTDSAAKGLLADDHGAVFLWTVFVALPVFFALGAVVVDAHRTYNTFDEAQSFADHTALAAARELNGRPGAIDRAIKAACEPVAKPDWPSGQPRSPGPLVEGTHTYGNAAVSGARALAADQLVFLSALGPDPMAPDQYVTANDPTPICEATCAAPGACQGLSDALNEQARFVSVTTAPVTVSWLVAPVMNAFGVNLGASANAAARATAGMPKVEKCGWVPFFICNPTPGQSLGHPDNVEDNIGMQVLVLAGTEPWCPGNRGLLSPPAPYDTGGAGLGDALEAHPLRENCTSSDLLPLYTKTGETRGPVRRGINDPDTRFCDTASNLDKMPRDFCFRDELEPEQRKPYCRLPNDNTYGVPRFGKRDWCGNPPCPTRFEQYKDQIASQKCPGQTWPPPEGLPDSREFIVAVVDCEKLCTGGQNTYATVSEYARMFITERIPSGSDYDIYMEYIGPVDFQILSDVFKEYPVLYR